MRCDALLLVCSGSDRGGAGRGRQSIVKGKASEHFHLQDELVVLLEGLLLVVGVLLLFVQLLAHVHHQLLHGEVEHQSEDVGGHHPTLDHLVHTSYLGDQGVVFREETNQMG
ncbi:uncharacterized protein LOC142614589 [Castanea sativa]|uniref:uncharacterized protein LOC142614589 n=1 Tax=Castanea sativa TaxID=21020 RepID=UPI003F653FCB